MITVIRPTEQPALWLAHRDDERYEGQTALGELTGIAESYAVVSAEGEMAYMAAASATPTLYSPLPDVGQPVEANRVYRWDDTLLMARQSHNRTHHAPEDTPDLFAVYRPDADETLDWIAGEQVHVGTRRIYDGIIYRCIQAHTIDDPNWTPPATLGVLWEIVEDEAGDEIQPWVRPTGAHDAYRVGDWVTHNGRLWECTAGDASGANSWEPGVYGWTDRGPAP